MDMLVTTPKVEIENSRAEADIGPDGYWFRTYRFRPKVECGDRIYFVEDGMIRGYGIIFEVCEASPEGEECDTTGRIWNGKWVVKYRDWHWIKNPLRYNGFQGIRYLNNIPELEKQLKEGE